MAKALNRLLAEIRDCTICAEHLPFGPRPIVAAHEEARILVIGQAPGKRVHESGIPWDDPSGTRLREWMGVDEKTFYDPKKLALMPMGFCYPGTGKSGDLPPRPECREAWHEALLRRLPNVRLTLLLSRYAQSAYLQDGGKTVTENVRAWNDFAPSRIPLPHPSPRNNIWLKKNPWFAAKLLPVLQASVAKALRARGRKS